MIGEPTVVAGTDVGAAGLHTQIGVVGFQKERRSEDSHDGVDRRRDKEVVYLFPAAMIFEGSGGVLHQGVMGRWPQARHVAIRIVEVTHNDDLSQRIIPQQRIDGRFKNA